MAQPAQKPGYTDTPQLPHCKYKVHDSERPQPRVVAPGSWGSPEKAGTPPSDAKILFRGGDLSNWMTPKGEPANWKLEGDYMEVVAKTSCIRTREQFGDCQLHLEWAAPSLVAGEGQGRGNSGVFLMGIYEIQVLDCYQNPTYADGTTAAIYGQYPPLVNACRKPGEWQTYDIVWVGPRFEGTRLTRPARVTVLHNGVLVHHDTELIGPTTHRKILPYTPHPPVGPLELQDHGNPVRFRNIWYRPLTDYDQA